MSNVLIVPGSYKSTITSSEAGDIICQYYKSIRESDIVEQIYITDGGEGTIEAFSRNFGGKNRFYVVHGMNGEKIIANTLWLDSTKVVIESSSVVGYSLIPDAERNPWELSSFGIGELLLLTKQDGAKEIYITMGDSSIMDIGLGMLQALGVEFFDENNQAIKISDLSLIKEIKSINYDSMISFLGIKIYVLVDTKDYLIGEFGQTAIYGKQKGLRQEQAMIVEKGYKNYVKVIKEMFSIDLSIVPMATGSGGLAASLYAFLDAKLLHCPLYIAEKINLKVAIEKADVLITGEGILDNQTRWGKIPYFVSKDFYGHIFLIVGDYSKEGFDDIVKVSNAIVHIIKLRKDVSYIVAMEEAVISICMELDKIL